MKQPVYDLSSGLMRGLLLLVLSSATQAAPLLSAKQIKTLQQQLGNQIQYLSFEQGSCLLSTQPIRQEAITVVYADSYQEGFHYDLVQAQPLAKSNACIDTLATEGTQGLYFYRVEGHTADFIRGYGFELKPEQVIYQQRKIVGINLLGQKQAQRITECASSEGTHFNIWQTDGAKFKKLLHRYTYLNMDLESNCQDKDYAPGVLDQVEGAK